MREAGIEPEGWLTNPSACDGIRLVVARLLDAAHRLYSRARAGIAVLPAGCRPAVLAAALIYAEIGREVERNAYDSVTQRARVSGTRKVRLLVRSLAAAPLLSSGAAAPALDCSRFLLEAVANERPAPRRPRRATEDWRGSFVAVLETFERLQRAERFGD